MLMDDHELWEGLIATTTVNAWSSYFRSSILNETSGISTPTLVNC